MRYAIFYTPPPDDALTRAAETWLGRSAFTGETIAPRGMARLSASELSFQTASARRYGFHATLKAPFRLAPGEAEEGLVGALEAFCAQMSPFEGPRLVARQLDGFFALVPETPNERLDELAGAVVSGFERFRAPLTEAEFQRRNPDALTPAQIKNLHLWGYPYVFDTFRFHMTLSGRAGGGEATRLAEAIDAHFGSLIDEPVEMASLALFCEPDHGGPFMVRSFHHFGGAQGRAVADRKTA